MLDLVNMERASAGLRPLVADDQLREVARAHSLEMFQSDYFSHTSPTAGSPFDRMHAAGISFVVAGENLAYAPNVQVAHQGLMASPGQIDSQGDCSMNARPVPLSIDPQVGNGGGTP